jgi:uncharacterized protein (DUF488 family)
MKLYTIGHSTAELPALIDTLRSADIEVLVDVRSKPRSRMQHFDFGPLEAALEQAGIRYRFLGDRLGGMPRDPEIAERWHQGRLDSIIVAHLRSTDEWHDGLDELARIVRAADEPAACIMCSEANPDECHRKAVALDMTEIIPGLEIEHLAILRSAPSDIGVQEVLL